MAGNSDKMDAALANLKAKSKYFHQVFRSSQGKQVLEALEKEFDHENIKSGDPHETYYRLGQRDVVVYIRQLIEHSEKQND